MSTSIKRSRERISLSEFTQHVFQEVLVILSRNGAQKPLVTCCTITFVLKVKVATPRWLLNQNCQEYEGRYLETPYCMQIRICFKK